MASTSGLRSIMEDIATTTAVSSQEVWLNLSIGNPAPIPEVIALWRRLVGEALEDGFEAASCSYGPSRGLQRLVDAIVAYFNTQYGWPVRAENIVVGPGSQLLGFVAGAMFAGPGEGGMTRIVLPAVPDYTGYQGLCMHPGGITGIPPAIDFMGDRLFRYSFDFEALRREEHIGMLLVSSPSNPTGRCLRPSELDELVRIAERCDVPLVIDHAYGAPFPQIVETQTTPRWHPNVINFFTMSKAGMPGERIAFAIGDPRYINPMVSFIANSVLHAPQLCQLVLARALETGALDEISSTVIKPYYQNKRRLGEKLLADILPDSVDWRLHASEGGMFCWLWINHDWFDDNDLYQRLKQEKVFVVPGRHFFVDPERTPRLRGHATKCVRLSLSAAEPVISEGIERLAATMQEMRRAS
jgi:valine--pyruvate aminotransferase